MARDSFAIPEGRVNAHIVSIERVISRSQHFVCTRLHATLSADSRIKRQGKQFTKEYARSHRPEFETCARCPEGALLLQRVKEQS